LKTYVTLNFIDVEETQDFSIFISMTITSLHCESIFT